MNKQTLIEWLKEENLDPQFAIIVVNEVKTAAEVYSCRIALREDKDKENMIKMASIMLNAIGLRVPSDIMKDTLNGVFNQTAVANNLVAARVSQVNKKSKIIIPK